MTFSNRKITKLTAALTMVLAGVLGVVSAQSEDDPVVLRAGEYVETLSDLDARFEIAIRGLAARQGLELTDEVRAQLESFKASYLEQRATEVALLQEANERDITISEEEVDALVEQVRSTLAEGEEFSSVLQQAGFESEEQLRELVRETELIQRAVDAVEAEVEVTDAEVEEFFAANPSMFEQAEEVCARHILVESVEEAEQTVADLESGGDFAELAAERSIDPGSPGGDLGCFGRGRMVPSFEEAAFAAEVGETVGPVESQFGQHVIQVYERNEAQPAELSEVRDDIEQQLQREKLGQVVEQVREEAEVETFPDRLPGAASEPATEGENEGGNESENEGANEGEGEGNQ